MKIKEKKGSSHVEDINIHYALHSGINILSFEGVGFFRLQEISMFIEYTYQAR